MTSGEVIPAAFALLPSQNKDTYTKMWSEINKMVEGYKTTTFVIHMEPASSSTFLAIFGHGVVVVE